MIPSVPCQLWSLGGGWGLAGRGGAGRGREYGTRLVRGLSGDLGFSGFRGTYSILAESHVIFVLFKPHVRLGFAPQL